MVKFSLHMRKDAFWTLAADLAQIFTFQPGAVSTSQYLDRRLFGLLKKRSYRELLLDSGDSVAVFIRRPFHSMQKTVMSYNARTALARLRFRDAVDLDSDVRILAEFVLPGSQGRVTF
jgi:hypothetical protein